MPIVGLLTDIVLNRLPKFMRGKNLARFLSANAFVMDAISQTLAEGLKQSNPLLCDPVSFPALSKDRGIRLYPNEPVASKRYRLSRWHQIRRHRGSAYGAMIDLQPYFLPGTLPTIYNVHQSGDPGTGPIATWHKMDPAGVYSYYRPPSSNWNYDDHPEKWSRHWWFIDMSGTGIAPPHTYGDGSEYGDGSVYGGVGLSDGKQKDIVQLLIDNNPPHAWVGGIILVWTANALDITATPVQDPTGWWNLPNGAGTWEKAYDPVTHLGTRPPYMQWIMDNPAP